MLFRHAIPWLLALALAKAGKSIPARMAMIAMTTSNSIKVNPDGLACSAFMVDKAFIETQRKKFPQPRGSDVHHRDGPTLSPGDLQCQSCFHRSECFDFFDAVIKALE